MKRLLLILILLLLPSLCFGFEIQGSKPCPGGGVICDPGTNEIGDRTTDYSVYTESPENGAVCFYTTADCTGTLGYAYVIHDGSGNDNAEISVYRDNGATPATPDTTDAKLTGMTPQQVSSSTDGAVVKTTGKLGGSVVQGQGYFICVGGDATLWHTEYYASATVGGRWTFSNNQFPYGSPPATLSAADSSDTAAGMAVYVEIE